MTQRIAVLGAGGIGGCIGAYLLREGHDVTLIDQWAAHIEAMRTDGLTVNSVAEEFTVPVANAWHLSDVGSRQPTFDLVFLSVKSYDTIWQAHLIKPYLSPSGVILPAMNALNDEKVAQVVGYSRVMGCVTTISAGVYEPGRINRTDPLTTQAFTIGEFSGLASARAQRVADMLSVIGKSSVTTNLWGVRWGKLLWNSMGNAMAGMMGADAYTMTAEQTDLERLIRVRIGIEVCQVARAVGVALKSPIAGLDPSEMAEASTPDEIQALKDAVSAALGNRSLTDEQVARLRQPNRPSLAQDVLKHRRTEVDFLNGEVVRQAQFVGIETPVNQLIIDLMHKIEAGNVAPGGHNLETLKEQMAAL